jgi:hypothetical protein
MSKVYGIFSSFEPVRKERTRIVYGFCPELLEDGKNGVWYETVFYRKQNPHPTLEQVKKALFEDIDNDTKAKIIGGFMWEDKPVWLSLERQMDFSTAFNMAVQTDGDNLPLKLKLGEDDGGNAVYHTFRSLSSFKDFYTQMMAHIQQCRNEGWKKKDGIDWSDYGLE